MTELSRLDTHSTYRPEWQAKDDAASLPLVIMPADKPVPASLIAQQTALMLARAADEQPATAQAPIVLNKPAAASKSLSTATRAELKHSVTNRQQGYEMDTVERAVAGVATLCGSQLMSTVASANGSAKGRNDAAAPVSDAKQAIRSSPNLEGGTDITAPASTDAIYSNVVGNASMLQAFVSIMKALNQQEIHANQRAAQWSQNIMASAQATGNNLINAAKDRQTGALSGGITGLSMGVVGAGLTLRSVGGQIRSLNNNMAKASRIDLKLRDTQREIKSVRDNMMKNGDTTPPETYAQLMDHHSTLLHEREILHNNHSLVGQQSVQTRAYSECLAQGARVTHDSLDRTFDVSASAKNKEAEMTRANQTVSGEVDNAHLQSGKKASEGESALRQSLATILSHSNESVGAVASRMG